MHLSVEPFLGPHDMPNNTSCAPSGEAICMDLVRPVEAACSPGHG